MPIDLGLATVIGTVKSVAEGVQAVQKMSESADVKAKTAELYNLILGAQTQILEANIRQRVLLDERDELEKQIAALKAWDREKLRYALRGAEGGLFVYVLKRAESNGEPPHWICAHCYELARKSLLQSSPVHKQGLGRVCEIMCPACEFKAMMNRSQPHIEYAD